MRECMWKKEYVRVLLSSLSAKPSNSRARARETRNVAKSSLDLINVAEIEVANGRQHKKEDR